LAGENQNLVLNTNQPKDDYVSVTRKDWNYNSNSNQSTDQKSERKIQEVRKDIISLLGENSETKGVPKTISAGTSQTLHHLLLDYFLHSELLMRDSSRSEEP
jgi:hypothetical protein